MSTRKYYILMDDKISPFIWVYYELGDKVMVYHTTDKIPERAGLVSIKQLLGYFPQVMQIDLPEDIPITEVQDLIELLYI